MHQHQPINENGSHSWVDLGLSTHVVRVRMELSLCSSVCVCVCVRAWSVTIGTWHNDLVLI